MSKHLINIHSNELAGGGAKLPDPQQIEYGEIAVNYAESGETIAIKNENDEIVEFKPHKFYGPVLSGLSKDITEINDFLFPENLNKAGTLIYTKNDGKYYAVAADDWSDDLGTQVGVIVIPQGVLPDGKVRIMGIKGVDSAGTLSDTEVTMPWGGSGVDVEGLTNYYEVPVVDPETNEIRGLTSGNSYLPSDKFSTRPNPLDIGTAWYSSSNSCAPSPYKDGALNPAYCATEYTGGTIANCFSDFSGLENTQLLCQSAGTYVAANAAHLYKAFDGDTLEWYLPAMGELGFIMPRFNAINEALASVGGVALASSYYCWSSSEYSSNHARHLNTSNGNVSSNRDYYYDKNYSCRVRPFARLDTIVFPEPEGDNLNTRIQSYTESKQDKVDNALTTESKEVVGAINEIVSYIGLTGNTDAGIKELIKDAVKEYLSGVTKQITLSESGNTLNVGFSDDAVFGDTETEY